MRSSLPQRAGCARAGPRVVRAVRSARPVTLAPRAPEGGDWVPLVCCCANFKLPQLGEERAHRARKLHLRSFTLSWAGEGWEETRPPRGQARRLGGRKGGSRFPSRSGASSVLGPADEADGQYARQTNTCWGGQEAELLGPVVGPCLPPGRARAASGRARRFPAESPADQRASGKGRRECRRRRSGRSLYRAAGDPRPSPSAL